MTCFVLLLISVSSFAQSVYSPDFLQPVPHLKPKDLFKLQNQRPEKPKPNPTLKREAATVGRHLRNNFEAIKSHLSSVPNCDSEAAAKHTEALRMSGQYVSCQEFLQSCLAASKPVHQGVYLHAASCSADLNQFEKAKETFEKGLAAAPSMYFEMLVYQYASFAKFGIYPDKTTQIIERNFEWKTLSNVVDGVLELAAFGKTTKATAAQMDAFLMKQVVSENPVSRALFLNVKLSTLIKQYKYLEAKNFLAQNSANMLQPQHSWNLAYITFYSQSPATYTAAREIYNPILPYLHENSYLPMEQNTYNYTELYQSVCRHQLLQGSDFDNFTNIKSRWKSGELSASHAIAQLEALNQAKPNRADLISTLAGLYRLEGQVAHAKQLFWNAHLACPYYNRAHWGLRLLNRKALYEAYPEFRSIEKKVAEAVPESTWPDQAAQYFLNWHRFDNLIQRHVIYGARVWLPHIPFLMDNDMGTYLKLDFELLSEAPNLAGIRDQRIGGANYPNDNRLWDDVRGLGGGTVVSDIWETYYTAHGDYNLLGHEMAHQFQRASEQNSHSRHIVDCIVDLYREAKEKSNFPDGYSAQNKEEHFAQGVTYYLIPDNSPPRFGVNRSWVEQNNPRQFRFVYSIDASSGNLERISCL